MIERINKKRIFIYLGFAFGISWTTGLVIYFIGGLGLTLVAVLLLLRPEALKPAQD